MVERCVLYERLTWPQIRAAAIANKVILEEMRAREIVVRPDHQGADVEALKREAAAAGTR